MTLVLDMGYDFEPVLYRVIRSGQSVYVASLQVCPYVSDGAVKACGDPNGLELLAHARFGWSPIFRWAWLLEKRVRGTQLHS